MKPMCKCTWAFSSAIFFSILVWEIILVYLGRKHPAPPPFFSSPLPTKHPLKILSPLFSSLFFILSKFPPNKHTLNLWCYTNVWHGTLFHACLNHVFFFFFEKLWPGCGRNAYLLFIFSFNLEHLINYLLFTIFDIILGLYFNF